VLFQITAERAQPLLQAHPFGRAHHLGDAARLQAQGVRPVAGQAAHEAHQDGAGFQHGGDGTAALGLEAAECFGMPGL
jgi:hypothetical protein